MLAGSSSADVDKMATTELSDMDSTARLMAVRQRPREEQQRAWRVRLWDRLISTKCSANPAGENEADKYVQSTPHVLVMVPPLDI